MMNKRSNGFPGRSSAAPAILLAAALSATTVAVAAPALMGTVDIPYTNQLIIKLKSQQNALSVPVDVTSRLSNVGGVALSYGRPMSGQTHVFGLGNFIPTAAAKVLADRLRANDPDVLVAEPDYVQQAMATPNDTLYSNQWHYFDPVGGANLPATWDITTGSTSTVVAVVDTGYRPHADLSGKILPGYDFISNTFVANDGGGRDADASDPGDWVAASECYSGSSANNSSWHGTHVAGTIAAVTNNSAGVAGVNWNAKILPVRVLGKCGGYTSDIMDGVTWAAGLSVPGVPANPNPAKVINMSLGGAHTCSTTEQTAIDAATAAGAVVVVSAGNSNADASNYGPASCNNVITVAASGQTGDRAYYSNYGSVVEIAAPGGDYNVDTMVLSTLNAGLTTPGADAYAYYQGTSMAAPHVSGIASLMMGQNTALTPAQVTQIIRNTARAFPGGSTCNTSICGSGIIDAGAAVAAAAPSPSNNSLVPILQMLLFE